MKKCYNNVNESLKLLQSQTNLNNWKRLKISAVENAEKVNNEI